MAAEMLHDMRHVQPKGPYHLVGWSFGALLAFEMAQQIYTDGAEVCDHAVERDAKPVDHRLAHCG